MCSDTSVDVWVFKIFLGGILSLHRVSVCYVYVLLLLLLLLLFFLGISE